PASERQGGERQTGVRFAAALQAVANGGRVGVDGDVLVVDDADAVTLLLASGTDVRSRDPLDAALRALHAASKKPYEKLRADHVADYQRLFRRVLLDIAGDASRRSPKGEGGGLAETEAAKAGDPTDVRLKALATGAADPELAVLYFQFGRYLLISSSRPG